MSYVNLAGDLQLYYQLIEGDSDKPYLVFLHEGLGCIAMWKDFPQKLCELTGCPGLIYDRQGYGQSSAITEERTVHYLHNYALNELPQVLDAVIPNQSYILIGHSDGGSITLLWAAEQPGNMLAGITEAAHVFVEDETIAGIQVADAAYQAGKLDGLSKFHGDKTHDTFKAWSNTWRHEYFKHWNMEYALPAIQCPLLVMQGVDDQYGTEDQVNSIVEKSSGPAEAVMIPDCAHAPHFENQPAVLESMKGFVNKIIADQA